MFVRRRIVSHERVVGSEDLDGLESIVWLGGVFVNETQRSKGPFRQEDTTGACRYLASLVQS